jgi:hypothetical protein
VSRPTVEEVINGRLVQAFKRRGCIDVLVYDGPTAEGEPVGDWEMPVIINWDAIMRTAERQTAR